MVAFDCGWVQVDGWGVKDSQRFLGLGSGISLIDMSSKEWAFLVGKAVNLG